MSKIKSILGLNFKGNKGMIFYLVMTAFYVALYVIVDRFVTPMVSESLKGVSLNFIPIVAAAVTLGPVSSALVFGLGDFVGSILFPKGDPIIWLWFTYALMGFIYGIALYCPYVKTEICEYKLNKNEKLNKLYNVMIMLAFFLIALIINKFFISLFVNTYIIGSFFDPKNVKEYVLMNIPLRLTKNVIDVVVQMIALPILVPIFKKIKAIKR